MTVLPAPLLRRASRPQDAWLAIGLALVAAGLGVAAALAVAQGQVLAFGDAPSHLLIPRRLFDNNDPSIGQLGTHWGPFYHLLQAPLAWLGPAVRSGASGMAISMLCSLATCVFLYRLALLVETPRRVAFLAVVALVATPSFLYAGVIPMLYATITATVTANVYYLTRWTTGGGGATLLAAGLALTAANLSHFETWILWPIELGVVVAVAAHRWRARSRTEATAIVWLLASTYGLGTFVLLNIAIYGSPLAFLGSFSENPAAVADPARGAALAAAVGPGLSAQLDYPRAAWTMAGPALGVAALAGIVLFAWRWRRDPRRLVPLLLLYPFAWYLVQALFVGSWIVPGSTLEHWTNLRYAITILPAAAFFATAGLRHPALAAAAVVAVGVVGGLSVAHGQVPAWDDAMGDGIPAPAMSQAGSWIQHHVTDGRVIVPVWAPLLDRLELDSGLSDGTIIDINDGALWRRAVAHPWVARQAGVRWVLAIGAPTAPVNRMVRALGDRLCLWQWGGLAPAVRLYGPPADCRRPLVRQAVASASARERLRAQDAHD